MNQFEEMQTFIRIVEAGSITKASEQLNMVKSAVSKRLSDLEKRLGVSLLTRTTRNQTLTASGKSYYQQSLRLLDDLAELEAGIRNEHCALSGRIRIAAPLSFGLTHLSEALQSFNALHPNIYFEVDFNDRKVDLIEEGFDLAVRIARLEDSSMIAKRLFAGRGVLAASQAYLDQFGVPKTPKDLADGHVKLHYSGAKGDWYFSDAQGEEYTVSLPSVISANNGDFLLQSAINGKGLLLTPDFIAYKAIKNGQLIPLLTNYRILSKINGYAVYPQTRHLSLRVRSLVDFLVNYFGDKPYWRLD